MAQKMKAQCNDCGDVFTDTIGNTAQTIMFRCKSCGHKKSIDHEQLTFPRRSESEDLEDLNESLNSGRTHYRQDFWDANQAVIGMCEACGGEMEANNSRCPRCHSSNVEEQEVLAHLD